MTSKEELRLNYSKKFPEEKNLFDQNMAIQINFRKNLCHFISEYGTGLKIMVYRPVESEWPLLEFLPDLDVEWFFPVIRGQGLLARSKSRYIDIWRCDLILVPGLFVNASGYRLGRGGGYYDRILQFIPLSRSVFICRDWQIIDDLPVESHDRRVGNIITDTGVKCCWQQ